MAFSELILDENSVPAGNYLEEQSQEVEALESIYAEDFKQISETPVLQWQIHLEPYQGGEGENHGKPVVSMLSWLLCDLRLSIAVGLCIDVQSIF